MKNSASNLPTKQALQAKSRQLLPAITHVLSELKYSDITHQRLSQQPIDNQTAHPRYNSNTQDVEKSSRQSSKLSCYQGLTRAHHLKYGCVMIKWEMYAHHIALETLRYTSDLSCEVSVLQALHSAQKTQATAITPSILSHHDINIHALGQSQQLTILVMPYYTNGSLAKMLNHHVLLTDKQKHDLIIKSAELVLILHSAGWLHNDIKPSNILLNDRPTGHADSDYTVPDLLLTDFALAQKSAQPNTTNIASGTPAYLAPERWQGQSATIQSDIYAVGIMMVEILIGARPFHIDAKSQQPMTDWAIQHCQQSITRLPIAYAHYQSIIDKVLAKRVGKRYQNMDMVLAALKRLS